MKTMQEEWERFVARIYPDGLEADAALELKAAFMAGGLVTALAIGEIGSMPPAEARARTKALIHDLLTYPSSLRKSA